MSRPFNNSPQSLTKPHPHRYLTMISENCIEFGMGCNCLVRFIEILRVNRRSPTVSTTISAGDGLKESNRMRSQKFLVIGSQTIFEG
ncbi:hypothetical protein [Brunnivagina elsteri]|uniref:hypothetical protein n=1 Tax=Brunnivagina elsteri TaxID=1247191 RepID=UPI001B80BFEB|nr:hypothetical protein [Calothrix elsteri]